MKQSTRFLLANLLLLISLSSFGQSVIAEKEIAHRRFGTDYNLPNDKLLFMNLVQDETKVYANFEMYDKDLNQISECVTEIGTIDDHFVGGLSADSSKFIFTGHYRKDDKLLVVTVDYQKCESESQLFDYPKGFSPEFRAGKSPIVTNDNILWVGEMKGQKNKVFLWQTDLKSKESKIESIPNITSIFNFKTFSTWYDNSPFLCYLTEEKTGTLNFIDLHRVGAMSDKHFTTPVENGKVIISLDFYQTEKDGYVATGCLGTDAKSTESFYMFNIKKNHQIGELRSLHYQHIPNMATAIKYKKIDPTKPENSTEKDSYGTYGISTSLMKLGDHYFLSFRMSEYSAGVWGSYYSHDQLLEVDKNFELINSQIIQYKKTESLTILSLIHISEHTRH